MLNQMPGCLGRKLATLFELVYGVKPDLRTWAQPFSVGFFSHTIDNKSSGSKNKDQSIARIAAWQDEKTNTIFFYNVMTRSYYRPPAFRLDKDTLPVILFPKSISYPGGLTCGLMHNYRNPVAEAFPTGTRVNMQ